MLTDVVNSWSKVLNIRFILQEREKSFDVFLSIKNIFYTAAAEYELSEFIKI